MILNREQLLGRSWPIEVVPLPQFDGGSVRVKTLSAAEFVRLAELEKSHPSKGYALWWIACVCDEQGAPVFTEADIDALSALPFAIVNAVVTVARRLNGVDEAAPGNE